MTQKVLVQLVDDLDGTTSDRVTTVQFGLDGVTYEIDLTDSHAKTLRELFRITSLPAAAPVAASSVVLAPGAIARATTTRVGFENGPRRTASSSPRVAVFRPTSRSPTGRRR